MPYFQRIVAAVWLGSAVFLMLSSSAAFRAAGNASVAADVVGSMLTRWHYLALAAPLLLFVLELRSARQWVVLVLFTAVLLAASQAFVDLRIRAIRGSSVVPISELDRTDPIRRRFGALHGFSMLLLLLQALAAATIVAAGERKKEVNMTWEDREDSTIYNVVVNDEEQYSIWPADREMPLGWREAGFSGHKEACLNYIREVWTDMRPKSIRDDAADPSGGGP